MTITKTSINTNQRIGSFLLIIGLLMLAWMSYSIFQKWCFVDAAAITFGKVDKLNPTVITFQTDSKESFTFIQGWRSSNHPIKIGDQVQVAYLPSSPLHAEMVANLWTGQWIDTMFGVLLFALGYLMRKGLVVVVPLQQKRLRIE